MEKVEILAPAGSMESLVAAINKGADAVYLGGNKFSARAYASNFDNDNMLKAVDIPVQTIDFGHPNFRDSNLDKYNEGKKYYWTCDAINGCR